MARKQESQATYFSRRINRFRFTHDQARTDVSGAAELIEEASNDYKTEEVYKFTDGSMLRVNYRSERRYGFDKPEQNGVFEIVDAQTIKIKA